MFVCLLICFGPGKCQAPVLQSCLFCFLCHSPGYWDLFWKEERSLGPISDVAREQIDWCVPLQERSLRWKAASISVPWAPHPDFWHAGSSSVSFQRRWDRMVCTREHWSRFSGFLIECQPLPSIYCTKLKSNTTSVMQCAPKHTTAVASSLLLGFTDNLGWESTL